MGTAFSFGGKIIRLAGVYSRIISGVKNAPIDLDYGKVMIIDTGSGGEWGFGSGIAGTLKKKSEAIYRNITDEETMKDAVKGGLWWKLAEPLFHPDGVGSVGASEVIFARAAETEPAEFEYVFDGGSFTLQARDEGVVGNGVAVNSGELLTKGFGAVFSAGLVDEDKFMLRLYVGRFTGIDPLTSRPYDEVLDINTKPELLAQSPEVTLVSELVDWLTNNKTVNTFFKLSASTIGTDTLIADDITDVGGLQLFALGTESYSSDHLDTILDLIAKLDYSIILVDKYADDVVDLDNGKIQYHIVNEARFDKLMIVGGANDDEDFEELSVEAAVEYNHQKTVVVHGGVLNKSSKAPDGFNIADSIFKAAAVTGRIAGLPPYVPPTFKGLKFGGERHALIEKEEERALAKGVLYTIYDNDFKRFVIGQGVDTLQNNENFINEDGTSFSIQIFRIGAQLNKELVINAKLQLFGDPNGVNRNTLSESVVTDWVKGFLSRKIAKKDADNLIIKYDKVVVTRKQDAYFVSYEFSPNSEINKMFLTGTMID